MKTREQFYGQILAHVPSLPNYAFLTALETGESPDPELGYSEHHSAVIEYLIKGVRERNLDTGLIEIINRGLEGAEPDLVNEIVCGLIPSLQMHASYKDDYGNIHTELYSRLCQSLQQTWKHWEEAKGA